MSASATEAPPLSVPDTRRELCPAWCAGMAVVFAALGVEQLLDASPERRAAGAAASATVVLCALALRAVLRRELLAERWMVPLASVVGLLGVGSELLHVSLATSPGDAAHLALALVLCGVGLIPQFMLGVIAGLALAIVSLLGVGEPAGNGWSDAIAGVAAASFASLLSNGFVHGLANRLGEMRRQDAQHAERLASALEALHISESRLRQLFDATSEGLLVHRYGSIVEVNAAATLLLARSRDQLVGAALSSLVVSTESAVTADFAMARPGAAWIGQALRPDGTRIPVEVTASTITLDGEQLSLTTLHDVSDRVRAEAALRTRLAVDELVRTVSSDYLATPERDVDAAVERALRRVMEFLGGDRAHLSGFLGQDRMVCTHEWTAAGAQHVKGATFDSTRPGGRWWIANMHRGDSIFIGDATSDLPPQTGALNKWLAAQGVRSFVAVPVQREGRGRGSLSVASPMPLRHSADSAISLLRIVAELTVGALDRAFSQRRLAASEARKAAILSSALDCIVSMDADGRVIEFNPAAEATFGWKREEVLGREMAELLIPLDQRDSHRAGVLRYLRERTGAVIGTRIEVTAMRRAGDVFPVELAVVATPIDGEPVFTAYLRDITQRKHVDRLRDELVATVSHELRTPLTSLRGFTELLLKRDFPRDRQRKFLAVIHNETIRLMKLVNDFLDLKRLQSGEQKLRIEKFDIADLMQHTVTLFRRDDGPHVFRLALGDGSSTVRGDSDRTQQVLANLVSNAVKFSPAGGEITLGTRREGDDVAVFVRDQGIGMTEVAMKGLFRKFYRVDNAETRSIGGTGLGLALVKEMVEAQGGRVRVESQPGSGSTICFTLPAASSAFDRATQARADGFALVGLETDRLRDADEPKAVRNPR